MNKKPLVSVVTITYNHESYISKTIDGVLMQKCDFDIEFIIANDNSKDETDLVVKEHLKKSEIPRNIKIKYFNHDENKGMMGNFSWALNKAEGKYIALCEGDDYWTDPYKLQKQVNILNSKKKLSMCTHEVSHKNIFVKNERTIRRFFSIIIYDIQLYGFLRLFYLLKLFIVDHNLFWFQKRTNDKFKRKEISKLKDFRDGHFYMAFCSILIRKQTIDRFFECFYKSDGAHQLILLMGAMDGGIYHFKDIMAVKCDQESSVSRNEKRRAEKRKINANPKTNLKIKKYKLLFDYVENKNDNENIQHLIDVESNKDYTS